MSGGLRTITARVQSTMDYGTLSSKPLVVDNSRSPNYPTGAVDEVEEIIRQHPFPQRSSFSSRPRSMRAPVRRRVRIESGGGKTIQMFEISSMEERRSMDGSDASSTSAMTMVTSATSSCTDPWSSSGGWVEEEEDEADFNWDHEDGLPRDEDDMLLVPKIEPIDDDNDVNMADLSDVKESVVPETPSSTSTPAQVKRPRGRPRKHPKPTAESLAKVAKGRSKTGCITCRRRKKKCDETKPGCKSDSMLSPVPPVSTN